MARRWWGCKGQLAAEGEVAGLHLVAAAAASEVEVVEALQLAE